MKKIILSLSFLLSVIFVNSQIIEPLQKKFDDRIPPSTFIDPKLIQDSAIISNSNGEDLLYSMTLNKNTYYVAIKMADKAMFYGIVYAEKSMPIDILNGLKLYGELVTSDKKHKTVYLYQTTVQKGVGIKLLSGDKFRNVYLWDYKNGIDLKYNEKYSFNNKHTGKLRFQYEYETLAPQEPAGGRRGGGRGIRKITHYTGGYYYNVIGTATQNITWKTKADTLILSYKKGIVNVKASLILPDKEQYSADKWDRQYYQNICQQYKADFPTNYRVKNSKAEISELMNGMMRKGEEKFKYIVQNDGDILIFRITNGNCDLSHGEILRNKQSDEYVRNEFFNARKLIEDGILTYQNFRTNQVSNNQIIYNLFTFKAKKIFDYINENSKYNIIDENPKLLDLFNIFDKNLDDGLVAFKGMTSYIISDINPIEGTAKLLFIRQDKNCSKICSTNLHFDENGIITKDALNSRFIHCSPAIDNLTKSIAESHEFLKKNRKNKCFISSYKDYEKSYKQLTKSVKFKTFDELETVEKNLREVVTLQEKYSTILNECINN